MPLKHFQVIFLSTSVVVILIKIHIKMHIVSVCHFWLHTLKWVLNLAYHLKARHAFPNGIPTMRGETKGPVIQNALKEEKKKFIAEAKEKLKLLLDQVDPFGHGGSMNTGMQYHLLKVSFFGKLQCKRALRLQKNVSLIYSKFR